MRRWVARWLWALGAIADRWARRLRDGALPEPRPETPEERAERERRARAAKLERLERRRTYAEAHRAEYARLSDSTKELLARHMEITPGMLDAAVDHATRLYEAALREEGEP